MTHIDENQEAIACIRMNVDAYDAELKAQADSDDIGEDLGKAQQAVQTAATPHAHWKFFSPGKCTTPSVFSLKCPDPPHFRASQKSLFCFLKKNSPGES